MIRFEDYESLFVEESYYRFFDDEPAHHGDIDMLGQFGRFIQMIADKLRDELNDCVDLKLNHKVKTVRFVNEREVRIDTAQGQFVCAHAIVCVSVCCL